MKDMNNDKCQRVAVCTYLVRTVAFCGIQFFGSQSELADNNSLEQLSKHFKHA